MSAVFAQSDCNESNWKESYEGDDPSAGPTPEEESEEDPEVKKIVEEKGITQEDVDRLMSIL